MERDGGRQQCADPHVAFFKLRQKFGAEPHSKHAANQQEHERDRGPRAIVMHRER